MACCRSCRKTSLATWLSGGTTMLGETSTTSTVMRCDSWSGMCASLGVRQDPADRVDQLQRSEWLREVLRRTGGEADGAVAFRFVCSEHDDRDVLRLGVGL